MDLLGVSSPYKSMNDSQKKDLLRNWIENYSEWFKRVQALKDKISDYNTSRVNLESEIASQDTIISSQKDLIDQLQNEIRDLNITVRDKYSACDDDNDIYQKDKSGHA